MATFRDGSGRQFWKSTGLTDRRAALAVAHKLEREAKRKHAAKGSLAKKPTIRVQRGSGKSEPGVLTQREVAVFLGISERAVRDIERRAIEKLRHHPALRALWREWKTGEVEEAAHAGAGRWGLSSSEIAAVYALAQTPEEREVLRRVLALVGARAIVSPYAVVE